MSSLIKQEHLPSMDECHDCAGHHHHHDDQTDSNFHETSIDIFPNENHHHHHHSICHHHHERQNQDNDSHHHHHHQIHFDEHESQCSRNGDTHSDSMSNADVACHSNLLEEEDEFDTFNVKPNVGKEVELVFKYLSQTISAKNSEEKKILFDISGYASPGQILAVMGPSGSGKTTLLNLLSGRFKPAFGEITLSGQKINKQLRRQICYVLQQDIFFPSLTLKQTLLYTARLRLPDSMTNEEKNKLVEKIIEELQLTDCQNTIIGDFSKRGLSGGEKKRANIACELLTNPSVMLIDEPTSGLDSCTAHNLIQILKNFAVKRQKTIVMTIHQPSSQIFYMLDRLLLLSNGRLAYFGNVIEVVPFFNSLGHCISIHYNPAEFILEKVKNSNYENKIIDAAKRLRKLPKSRSDSKCFDSHLKHCSKELWKKESLKSIELLMNSPGENNSHQNFTKIIIDSDSGRSSLSETDRSSVFSSNSFFKEDSSKKKNLKKPMKKKESNQKWPTSWWTQIKVLTERNFLEAKSRMLSKLNWIQTIILAIIAGLIWFQIVRREETLNDIRGWMFFTTTYWMLFGLFQALVSFPSEREVINKERSAGAYRLSSYYIAKMIGELPLTIALPSVFFFISYPMLGCHSAWTFLSLWFFLIISTICAQSVGLFFGAAFYDLEVSVTISALYSLSTMLFAGYYTSMPAWLSWMRYFSMVYYAFLNMQMVEFSGSDIICSNNFSKYETCIANNNNTTTIRYEELELRLDSMSLNKKPFPIWFNTFILIIFLFVFRSLGYLVLKHSRRQSNK